MFNFIFEGKIGEILAPVVPSNQLFLAIQHHKNDEIQTFMSKNQYDVNEKLILLEGGYAAIHVACRYNNKFALELILSKGISVDFSDQNGNSPLHYGAKYGNLEICKILIKAGASITKKNKSQHSAYDVAEGYDTVRQYLLPLLFQAERNNEDSSFREQNSFAASSSYLQAQPQNVSLVPAPLPAFPSYSQPVQQPVQQPVAPDGLLVAPPYVQQTINRPALNPARVIRPDGFHSSASDPELQAKYGHIKEVTNIAPPPTGIVYQPPTAGGPPPYAGNIYNRYVPYDAHTNSAATLPPAASHTHNSYISQPAPTVFVPPRPQDSQPQPSTTGDFSPHPRNLTRQHGSPSMTSNSLLGNKTVAVGTTDFLQSAPVIKATPSAPALSSSSSSSVPERPRPMPMVSVFNPTTDSSVTVTSSASSIL